MARFGFVGGTYISESPNVDAEECFNWYVESTEGSNAESPLALYPTPGSQIAYLFANGPGSVPMIFEIEGRTFALGVYTVGTVPPVTSCTLFELTGAGSPTSVSNFKIWTPNVQIPTAALPASMAANNQQLMICTGGQLYCFVLATNVMTNVTGTLALPNPVSVEYADDSFKVCFAGTNSFQLSNLNDGTTWNSLNTAQVSKFPGNIVASLVDHSDLWLWGNRQSQVYFDSGSTYTPYAPYPGAFIETGCAALQSPIKMDNSVFWIGQDERGQGIAWRASGFLPVRVSTHAVELAWSQYKTLSDAVSYSYQERGHTFWMVRFPTANATWCYDAATNLWHRRGVWGKNAAYAAHDSVCHLWSSVYAESLIGSGSECVIWQMSANLTTDQAMNSDGTGGYYIRRQRDAPAVSSEKQWLLHHSLQVDLEPGLGTVTGQGQNPQCSLQWSNNAAKTWSSEYFVSAGPQGDYDTRVIWRRLGRSRNRIYRLVVSDPIPWRITDAYLEATPGFQKPAERLLKQLGKVA